MTLFKRALFSLGLLVAAHAMWAKIIHITPGAFGNIFDGNVKIGNAQITCARLRDALHKIGYELQQGASFTHLRNPEYIIFFDLSGSLQELKRFPKEKRVLFLWEPPASDNSLLFSEDLHQHFGKIFTWNDSLVDNQVYIKFHYPQPTLAMKEQKIPFEQRKLCCLFACNKQRPHSKELYSARLAAINFFENNRTNDFDFYGVGWERNHYRNFRGYVFDKISCLSKYKFNVCYENTKDLPGYVTEKIFDCFVAGTVPIYWGANNITDFVPKECFIDRRNFSSFPEVYNYIRGMKEGEYAEYINNIRQYLESEQAQLFSSQYFITTFIEGLNLQ